MNIAVVTWSPRRVGGVETYLAALPAALRAHGHDIGLWHEIDGPGHRTPIAWDAGPVWSAATLGHDAAVSALHSWRPDVIYAHGLDHPALEQRVMAVAPAVFFAHNYYGTCISGAKSFKAPVPRPCNRRFGAACFLHYYPHRCGGLSPVTMVREYGHQARRLATLAHYRVIATASEHMRREFLTHGLADVRTLGLPTPPATASAASIAPAPPGQPVRIVFAGRMEPAKGGAMLLAALPAVRRLVNRRVELTLMGDGTSRQEWERLATAVTAADPGITIRFTGWASDAERAAHFAASDVLALPSVWPEPFGLVGLEAAAHGVPSAAFAVGGIPEWLTDGANGHLAAGDPPQAAGLADAIARCVADPKHHAELRRGAIAATARFGLDDHVSRLLQVLTSVAQAK